MDFQWFLPSMYGDISLARVSDSSTRLTITGLAPTEKTAMQALFKKAVASGPLTSPWTTSDKISALDLDSKDEQTLELGASITKVQNFLQKQLKPHRKQISAVRFSSGRIEQVTEATLQVIDSSTPSSKETKKPKAAVTVAQPVLGCPAPDFDDVEIRATRVLKTFLTPEQVTDFERRQQFIVTGADTGHRYLITSRNSKHALSHTSFRSLYDIDEQQAFCVHDWEVPAAEEMLGLAMHVQLPGLERYVRSIPDRDGILDHARG